MSAWRTAALGLLLAGAVAAQVTYVGPSGDSDRSECLVLQSYGVPLPARPGGLGWAEVIASNPTAEARELELLVGHVNPTARQSVVLEPGETRRLVLPLAISDLRNANLMAAVDGGDRVMLLSNSKVGNVSILVVSDDRTGRGLELQQAVERALRGVDLGTHLVTTEQLPDDWTLLSGADLLLLDGSTRVPADAQQVLLDAAAAGAVLHVTRPGLVREEPGPLGARLREGAFADAPEDEGARARHGFGALSVGPAPDDVHAGAWEQRFRVLVPDRSLQPPCRNLVSGFPADVWLGRLAIPGLDDAPTGLFLALLMGFIAFVGGRGFWLLRQRRTLQLLRLLPVSGLSVTAGLLAVGLLTEGLGLSGVRRSLTLLDQRAHRAAGASQSTVYAALAPGALEPQPGTLAVSADDLLGSFRGGVLRRWLVDLDAGGRVAAGAIPPRTPTQLATSRVGVARERLRFRRVEDGFEVLAEPDMRPMDGAAEVLLRDFEGRWHVARDDGRLVPLSSETPYWQRRGTLLGLFGSATFDESDRWSPYASGSPRDVTSDEAGRALDNALHELVTALPPGSYVARMRDVPFVDDLGLDVDWIGEQHLVLGLLAPEDIDG